jgi:dipeptidyl aminopeptidase/acylaminoacyl peptidase
VQWSPDASTAYFVCNRSWPGDYEVCALPRTGGTPRELTALDGVQDFTLSPTAAACCCTGRPRTRRRSWRCCPRRRRGAPAHRHAHARVPRARVDPAAVRAGALDARRRLIWAKLYRPATLEPGRKYPVVMFVHGAGYLQNVSARYPNYFREQMFNNLLVQQGYVVLDMDYRASEGYGRDWRNAIYRRMGTPELEDYIDGVNWMVANQQGDAANVGIYGGSYGGFMAFMALFKARTCSRPAPACARLPTGPATTTSTRPTSSTRRTWIPKPTSAARRSSSPKACAGTC